jgi:hypothetical protein
LILLFIRFFIVFFIVLDGFGAVLARRNYLVAFFLLLDLPHRARSQARVHHLLHHILPRYAMLRHLCLEDARTRTRALTRFRLGRRKVRYRWYAARG